MAMAWIWTGMICLSVLFGLLSGRGDALSGAAMEGARGAVELCLTTGGMLCLWSGLMEVMERSGISGKLAKCLMPVLRRLFPKSSRDPELRSALAENLSANLLGLGNAATPAGIRAAGGILRRGETRELGRLVVMNTASLQLIPTTIAAVRAASGAENAFDILPAVWISSAVSLCVGLVAERLLGGKSA